MRSPQYKQAVRIGSLLILAALLSWFLTSCASTQTKLKRSVEKHGIGESVAFMATTYPKFFKTLDTVLLDTVMIHDSIIVPGIDFDAPLRDSLNYWVHNSDSLRVVIDKISNRVAVTLPPRIVSVTDTVIIETVAPAIPCPDLDGIQIRTETETNYGWIVAAFIAGVFVPILVGRVRTRG